MSESIAKPVNKLVSIIDTVIDLLFLGLGKEAVVAQVSALVPWLRLPIVSWIFTKTVGSLFNSMDKSLTQRINHVIIRYQSNIEKAEYNKVIKELNDSKSKSKEEHAKALQAAKDKIDKIVNRNH